MKGDWFGSALTWADNARNLGYRVDHSPLAGAIAHGADGADALQLQGIRQPISSVCANDDLWRPARPRNDFSNVRGFVPSTISELKPPNSLGCNMLRTSANHWHGN